MYLHICFFTIAITIEFQTVSYNTHNIFIKDYYKIIVILSLQMFKYLCQSAYNVQNFLNNAAQLFHPTGTRSVPR